MQPNIPEAISRQAEPISARVGLQDEGALLADEATFRMCDVLGMCNFRFVISSVRHSSGCMDLKFPVCDFLGCVYFRT